MAEPNQIVKFGNGLVDTAKALNVDPNNFINLDTTNTAIRYKKMAPIVIASRLKTMLAECTNEDENKKVRGSIAELETAQQHGINQGKCQLIHWSSIQSQNTIHAAMGVYNLYSSDGKPVCDFVLVSITQKRTVDKTSLGWGWCAAAVGLSVFLPVIGPIIASGILATTAAAVRGRIRDMTNDEQADVVMLKTLEHYGLIRLVGNDQIQLIND